MGAADCERYRYHAEERTSKQLRQPASTYAVNERFNPLGQYAVDLTSQSLTCLEPT